MAGRLRARRGDHSSGTPVAGRLKQPTRTTGPPDGPRGGGEPPRASLLFGFAPGGACHAADVAADAVRSYRTLSPLPLAFPLRETQRAVCFLWRFPWGRPRRTLSGAVSVWSPDFPLLAKAAVARPTGRRHLRSQRLRVKGGALGQRLLHEPARAGLDGVLQPLEEHIARQARRESPAGTRSPPSLAGAGSRAAPRTGRC